MQDLSEIDTKKNYQTFMQSYRQLDANSTIVGRTAKLLADQHVRVHEKGLNGEPKFERDQQTIE